MSKRLIALILAFALVLGVVPATATVANAEEGQYKVGYAKLDVNPYIKNSVTGDLGIAATTYSDANTYVGEITMHNPNKDGSLVQVPFVKIPMGGYGSATNRLAGNLSDDNGDGFITLGDGLFTTATSVTDANGTTIIYVTLDALDVDETLTNAVRAAIVARLGSAVPADHIIVSGSHSHEGPDLDSVSGAADGTALKAYYQYMVAQMTEAAVQAFNNKSDAVMSKGEIDASEAMKTMGYKYADGSGYKMNFNRHYNMEQFDEYEVINTTNNSVYHYEARDRYYWVAGDNFGEMHSNLGSRQPYRKQDGLYPWLDGTYYHTYYAEHVSDADDTMQVLKFAREGADDVVMINWQAHPSIMGGSTFNNVSSDYINALRYYLEKAGYCVAFWQGTSGNINPSSSIMTEYKFREDVSDSAGYGTIRLSEIKVPFESQVAEGSFYADYYAGFGVDSEGNSRYADRAYRNALYGYLLGMIAMKCLDGNNMETNLDQGAIRVLPLSYVVNHRTYDADQDDVAKAWKAAKDAGSISSYPWYTTLSNGKTYGINSEFHGNNLYIRTVTNPDWQGVAKADTNIALNVIVLGENVALLTSSGELFDRYDLGGSVLDKDNDWNELMAAISDTYGNPFVVSHALKDTGYIPNALAYTYKGSSKNVVVGSYESNISYYGSGTGEAVIATFKEMLKTISQFKEDYCEHCQKDVVWTPVTASNADTAFSTGHYYLTEDITSLVARIKYIGTAKEQAKSAQVCFDLNGHSVFNTGRFFYVYGYSTLNVMDTVGGGSVTCAAYSNSAGGGVVEIQSPGVLNLYGGTFKYEGKGTSAAGTSLGGVVSLQGTMNVYDGVTIIGGAITNTYTSSSLGTGLGGAICVYNGATLRMYGGEVLSGSVPTTAVSKTPCNLGPCVYSAGTGNIYLYNDASIEDLYFYGNDGSRLVINGQYTGKLGLTLNPDKLPLTNGKDIGTSENADLSGATITCTNNNKASLYVNGSNLCMVVPGASDVAMGYTSSGAQPYATLNQAVEASTSGYVKLINNVNAATLTENGIVDLAGFDINALTVADGKEIQLMDSATDDFNVSDGKYSKIKLTDANKDKISAVTAESGVAEDGYLMITEEENGDTYASFHRIKLQIKSMSLRAKEAGLYYSSSFVGDEMVAELIGANDSDVDFGVALSLTGAPNAENLDTNCLYSKFTGFQAGVGANDGASTSTMLVNVINTERSNILNDQYAKMKVYGRAFAVLPNGQYVFGKTVSRSLRQQVEATDAAWNQLTYKQRPTLMEMYDTFGIGESCTFMNKWNIPNTKKEAVAEDRDVLKVLILGNSHGLDATNFLAEVFKAEAPEKKVVLGALYYDGCNLGQHSTFLLNDEAVYEYYKNATFDYDKGTNNDGTWRMNFGRSKEDKVTAMQGLLDETWDIIVMQQMNHRSGRDADFADSYFKTIISYLDNSQNPDATLMWHMVWANPDTDTYMDSTQPLSHPVKDGTWQNNHNAWFPGTDGKYDMNVLYDNIVRCASEHVLSRGDYAALIPSGTAIQHALNVQGRSLENMYRDYTHMSDYGRLVAAYCWYATIMDVTEFDTIKIGDLPAALHHSRSTYPVVSGDVIPVSAEDKADLMEAVNYALANPLTNPGK